MDALPPPANIVAPVAQGAACAVLTPAQAQSALRRLSARLKATRFVSAAPSAVPGLVVVRTAEGQVGYTDGEGRYFIVGVVFDTLTGEALDRQLKGTSSPTD